jgi:hypothetical protein
VWLKSLTLLEQIGVVAGAVAAVAGAIAAVLALSGGPQPAPRAELRVTRFEPDVPLGVFSRRYPESVPGALAGSELARPGGVLFLDLRFHDFRGHRCDLSWTMYDRTRRAPVEEPGFVDQPVAELPLDSSFEHVVRPVWVPAPVEVEEAHVLFTLRDGDTPCGSPFRSGRLPLE